MDSLEKFLSTSQLLNSNFFTVTIYKYFGFINQFVSDSLFNSLVSL